MRSEILLLASLVSGSQIALAIGDDPCHRSQNLIEFRRGLSSEVPSYFIATDSKGERVFWINGSMLGQNEMTVMNSSAPPMKLPGMIDPVLSPDDNILSYPDRFHTGVSFFDFKDKSHAPDANKPIYVDKSLTGSYQSMGITQANADGSKKFRVITDGNGASVRDYNVSADGKMTPIGETKRLCPDLKEDQMQLPMMSKDGSYLSVYDGQAGETRIYKINAQGSCKIAAQLGVATGKADFDFQNGQVAFHMDSFDFQKSHFSGVSDNVTKDVFIAHFVKNEKGDIIEAKRPFDRLTFTSKKGSGYYYPRFNRDGKITAVEDNDNKFSFVRIDPEGASSMVKKDQLNCLNADSKEAATAALIGQLWVNICADAVFHDKIDSFDTISMLGLGLNKKECENLINKYWDKQRLSTLTNAMAAAEKANRKTLLVESNAITKNDLLAACPQGDPAKAQKTLTAGEIAEGRMSPAALFSAKCSECHTGSPGKKIDFNHLDNTTKGMVKTMIESKAMPPKSPLSESEKITLLGYLNQK